MSTHLERLQHRLKWRKSSTRAAQTPTRRNLARLTLTDDMNRLEAARTSQHVLGSLEAVTRTMGDLWEDGFEELVSAWHGSSMDFPNQMVYGEVSVHCGPETMHRELQDGAPHAAC